MMMTGGARRCSHCGNNGHNSRTCNDRKVSLKLFGVRIVAEDIDNNNLQHGTMQRSLSMGHLAYHQHLNYSICDNADNDHDVPHHGDDGYLSDGLTQYSSSKPKVLRRRKKGVPWTAEEHTTFLIGLKTLGRGDWRGISKNFVHTRTPTQVASHAQKYFMRQLSGKDMKKRKRRMSLFDLPLIGDLSLKSPTTPFALPLEESPPRQAENLRNSSGDSSDNGDNQPSTFHANHSRALPPLSPQGQVFKELRHQGFLRIDVPKMNNYAHNDEELLKMNILTSVTPGDGEDTRLQLGLPSLASSNEGLVSSTVDDMLELSMALPVGLYSPSKLVSPPL